MDRILISRGLPGRMLLLAAAMLAPAAAAARADLHFPRPALDAGDVRCGTLLSHRFAFINRGPAPVEIVEVRAGCGCLTSRLERRTFQPGETGALLVEVNTLSQPEGPHTWTCQITYQSGGQRGDVALQIAGRVIAEVTVRPAVLTVFTDSTVAHELVLTDRRPRPLTVAELRCTSARLSARPAEPGKDDPGHGVRRIRLEVAPDYPEGRHEETLDILTDDPLYRVLRVPVTVIKRGRARVTALPPEVKIEAAAGQALPSCLLRLRDSQGQTIGVERIEADDPAIVCQWAPGPDTQATLKVRINRERLAANRLDSAIHVHISQPVRQTITIPVKCVIRD